MAQIFPKWTNEIPRLAPPVLTLAGALAIFVVWFWFSPKHTDVGYAPVQPVPYSHRLHAGELGMDCRYCHYNVDKSANAGIPATQVCMNCHRQVKSASARLEAVRASWQDGTPEKDGGGVPWIRIHKVGDYAYFNHSAHVGLIKEGAAIGCKECHGRIDQMTVVAEQEPLSMSWCIECHNDPAPRLRPLDQLTNMAWEPKDTPGWEEQARQIAQRLSPPGRMTGSRVVTADGKVITHATAGCTGCHR